MVQGEAQDTAAARLKHLETYFREHPVTGPVEGHAASRSAPAPLSLGTLSHIRASVKEVVDHTLETNPDAGPAPSRADAVYDWCREHTAHAPEAAQQRAETIEYRQYLEHCLRAGDTKVIPPHRCPECRCFGLMWERSSQRARCTNANCTDSDGFSHAFTLARLAHEHIAGQKSVRRARAT
ncbi:hypothetical protein [Streptomyces africanus]|uniref:hypothetical protein n=1 Tax=Streptomyces africanus TaxID=231024 RepID=UPI000A38E516|nr:hypothetical protein [Streptomyces africanus]